MCVILCKNPQDIELLNKARENTEDMITELHDPKDGRKPRTYKKQARKDYLNMVRKKKKTSNEIRKGIRKQLQYLARNLKSIDSLLGMGKDLSQNRRRGLGSSDSSLNNRSTCSIILFSVQRFLASLNLAFTRASTSSRVLPPCSPRA